MLGSKNRDYKTSDRAITTNIKKHIELMNKLMSEEGLSKEDASKKAFEIIVKGE